MFDTINLPVFIASGLLLNLTPGADVLFITTRSASQGRRAGVIAALGIGTGGCIHILCATLGLSALLATSAMAYTLVKLGGAAYLIYLGISTLRSVRQAPAATAPLVILSRQSAGQIFRQAILVNVLNPKVALFFLAFLPQFVASNAVHPALAFLFLGLIFNLNGTLVNLLFALGSAKIAGSFKGGALLPAALKTGVGALFLWLGLRLAFSSR